PCLGQAAQVRVPIPPGKAAYSSEIEGSEPPISLHRPVFPACHRWHVRHSLCSDSGRIRWSPGSEQNQNCAAREILPFHSTCDVMQQLRSQLGVVGCNLAQQVNEFKWQVTGGLQFLLCRLQGAARIARSVLRCQVES